MYGHIELVLQDITLLWIFFPEWGVIRLAPSLFVIVETNHYIHRLSLVTTKQSSIVWAAAGTSRQMNVRDNRDRLRRGVCLLEIFDAEVMIYGLGFTQRSGIA